MAETIQYKCPCCGGRLEFDSGLQKMKCPYCDTTFDVETLEGYDDALKQDAKDDMHWDAAQQPWDDVQMGVYAGKSASLDSIPSGAQIAVPSDTTNEARALQLLEKIGLIKLKEGAGLTATKNDIADNPHQIRIVETEAAQVPRTLQDVDFAVANGNYAISAGVTDKVLVKEDSSTKYGNIVAVKEGQESSAKTTALVEALTSDTVRQFIVDEFGETAVPMF